MNWNQLLSPLRHGQESRVTGDVEIERTQFQKDYDRIIFSSPFRRLQNKTQVFPLPGSIFVHNRLTHSLEVSSVGRSLGTILSSKLSVEEEYKKNGFLSEIGNIVGAACLAHDLGNPAFGHSGEKAISQYFIDHQSLFEKQLTPQQWADISNFEGNANSLRILTHDYYGRPESQYALTYSTIASLIKYPCSSLAMGDKSKIHRKKFGFFASEEEIFLKIASHLNLKKSSDSPLSYARHPLSFLVEAADDICYNIVDIEDAHRLGILTLKEVLELFLPLLEEDRVYIINRLDKLLDNNDKVSLLRAKVINSLVHQCADAFWNNHHKIMSGTLDVDLKSCLDTKIKNHLKNIEYQSISKIYNYHTVIEKEIAGYKIIAGLLEEFIPAILGMGKNKHYHDKLVQLIPIQFTPTSEDVYSKIMSILDFISGMTDLYAVELYRKIKGIAFPEYS